MLQRRNFSWQQEQVELKHTVKLGPDHEQSHVLTLQEAVNPARIMNMSFINQFESKSWQKNIEQKFGQGPRCLIRWSKHVWLLHNYFHLINQWLHQCIKTLQRPSIFKTRQWCSIMTPEIINGIFDREGKPYQLNQRFANFWALIDKISITNTI